MIVSALFRTASTHFCSELSKNLNLIFLDEVYDPLNNDILRLKRINHEFGQTLRKIDHSSFSEMSQKIDLWHNHSGYVINNHNYDIPWFESADLFYCRADLLGALQSMYELIINSKQPKENLWIYAEWMQRFAEYSINHRGLRRLVLAEDFGYKFRTSSETANDFVKNIYAKKVNPILQTEFNQMIQTRKPIKMTDLINR